MSADKKINPNQVLLDVVIAQRNTIENQLAHSQRDLILANNLIADLQARLAEALNDSANSSMSAPPFAVGGHAQSGSESQENLNGKGSPQ